MLQRIIPSSGESIPVIGLGTWIKFDVISVAEKQTLVNNVKLFSENGGKLIDTSPMYGNAEKVIGEVTKQSGIADKFFYATKVWTSGRDAGLQQMQSSMQKMQRITMDLIQVHNLVDYKTHLKTLRQWKEEGKVRYIGITHYTTSYHGELEKIISNEEIDFVQFNYSIGVRNAERSLLPAAMNKGVAVIINEPLEKGNLFKKVKGKELPGWAIENDMNTWAHFFLKYVISHPAVTCVIPATSSPKNLLDNLSAGEGKLLDEKMKKKMVEFFERL
ncbi:MAG TPA: aldo/keto reductase [Chitinophagaceae bacterium]|nr:aldo/keto reductase [Chitinophagaceae bacterium]